jgi:hypothetical protein
MASDQSRAKKMYRDVRIGNMVYMGIYMLDDDHTAMFADPKIPTLRSPNKQITREDLRRHLMQYLYRK